VAIQSVVDERISDFDEAMGFGGGFRERLSAYVAQNQQPLLGCRVGRLVWDSAIEEEELRQPLEQYFTYIETRLTEILDFEQATGKVRLAAPSHQIALMIVSMVQGSFAISRALKRARAEEARAALLAFLALAVVDL
jgi:TetR/AcrR family transcriptional regulator, transcriptional repressor for nem operon